MEMGAETAEQWLQGTAAHDPKLRAMLGFLQRLTVMPESVGADDVRRLQEAGVSREAAEDAIYVCVMFNIINRMADALDFEVPQSGDVRKSAEMLLARGYRV